MPETQSAEPFDAVILAGGRGSRLYPFTAALPKPLLPIGERPLIEIIARRLAASGANQITVAVNHLADLVEAYLGDGQRFGLPIHYVRESTPLGTAGPLGLVKPWAGPLLVTNGDVLSDIDIRDLLNRHRETRAALTVATMLQQTRLEFRRADDRRFAAGRRYRRETSCRTPHQPWRLCAGGTRRAVDRR